MTKLQFNKYGYLENEIPREVVDGCAHSGICDEDVEYWVQRIGFVDSLEPVEPLARDYLREFGAWDDLDTCDLETIAQRILWTACWDIVEQGEWFGLVH